MTVEQRVIDIYKTYIEVICPYIIQYEVVGNAFPVQILNEIRAVFTHLGKYYLSDDDSIKEKNISKAEGHIKRAILDCYKYICIAYEDKYAEFEKRYSRTDLSFIDDGEFLPKLLKDRKKAVGLMIEARKSDIEINSDDETNCEAAYKRYEEAFVAYSAVYDLVNDSFKKLENLRRKAVFKDFLLGSGWIFTLIGIVLAIIFRFF